MKIPKIPKINVKKARAKREGKPWPPKKSKYKATGVRIDGHYFHSKAEGTRYCQLKLMEEEQLIDGLELQPRFKLVVRNALICTYVADFRYQVVDDRGRVLRTVVEDVKGMLTPEYKIKAKLTAALVDHEIREIPARHIDKWAGRIPE